MHVHIYGFPISFPIKCFWNLHWFSFFLVLVSKYTLSDPLLPDAINIINFNVNFYLWCLYFNSMILTYSFMFCSFLTLCTSVFAILLTRSYLFTYFICFYWLYYISHCCFVLAYCVGLKSFLEWITKFSVIFYSFFLLFTTQVIPGSPCIFIIEVISPSCFCW